MANETLEPTGIETPCVYFYECGFTPEGATNEYMLLIHSSTAPEPAIESPSFSISKKNGKIAIREHNASGRESVQTETSFLEHGGKVKRCCEPDALISDPSMYVEVREGLAALCSFVPEGTEILLEFRGYHAIRS